MNLSDRWEFYTVIALFLFVTSVIMRKSLFNAKCKFHDFLFVNLMSTGIISIFFAFIIYLLYKDDLLKDKNNKKLITVTSLASLVIVFGIIFKNKGYYLVNNVAVLDGFMEPSKVILLFLASYFLLNTNFNIKIFFGILLAMFGMVIIIKNQ
tara:strand:- start:896 stop:1351 length:456 start_codon:yes stop_codon:yes gene_type:complete